jgi:hypothetical protein
MLCDRDYLSAVRKDVSLGLIKSPLHELHVKSIKALTSNHSSASYLLHRFHQLSGLVNQAKGFQKAKGATLSKYTVN